ncbi:hypothetical protein IL306_011106 [Fusarium sp. DS 682]|nr:hypothetical protein IL306_011106 [Fusarium sp. DS 682]
MSSQRASFVALPNEMIGRIFELSDLSDHFNLALTCRRLKEGGQPTLMRHQKAYREYNLISDFLPLTVPSVLQKVVRDPYVAWNIRSIEIWGDRWGWDCWGSFRLEKPEGIDSNYEWSQVFENKIAEKYTLPDEDLDLYLDLLDEHADLFTDIALEDLRDKYFLQGADCLYKFLLILLCPRLQSLKHIPTDHHAIIADSSNYTMLLVSDAIHCNWLLEYWAPGFRNLREVGVGLDAGLWFQSQETQPYPNEIFSNITLLPQIKSVYFGCLDLGDFSYRTTDLEQRIEIPTYLFFSSIEHIFVDRLDDSTVAESAENISTFLNAPKALKSFTVRGDAGNFVKSAQLALMESMDCTGEDLETLIGYSGHQQNSGLFSPYDMADVSERLSILSVSVIRFIERGFLISNITQETMRNAMREYTNTSHSYRIAVMSAFPSASEVLIFRKSYEEDEKLDMQLLEEVLIALLECYDCLKVICLEQQTNRNGKYVNDYSFSKLVDAAWERKVDVYVRGNTKARWHQLDLPTPPTLISLERLKPRDQIADTTVDPFTGMRIVRELSEAEEDTETLAFREQGEVEN